MTRDGVRADRPLDVTPTRLWNEHDHRVAFVRDHTVLTPVPMVDSIRLHTATELLPLWRATEAWLDARGLGVPFWCVPWAGGQALARFVLDHAELVRGRRVLDFGTGSGLVAIAAARAGAARVRAVDIDPLAVTAAVLNAEANEVVIEAACIDLVGEAVDADVVLAGDIWYERAAATMFAAWLASLPARGVRVLTGDPGRHYPPAGTTTLATYDVPTSVELESADRRVARVLELTAG